jgi:hypothetical protein
VPLFSLRSLRDQGHLPELVYWRQSSWESLRSCRNMVDNKDWARIGDIIDDNPVGVALDLIAELNNLQDRQIEWGRKKVPYEK